MEITNIKLLTMAPSQIPQSMGKSKINDSEISKSQKGDIEQLMSLSSIQLVKMILNSTALIQDFPINLGKKKPQSTTEQEINNINTKKYRQLKIASKQKYQFIF